MRKYIKNGLIINPARALTGKGSIWIEDEKVACIEMEGRMEGKRPEWADDKSILVIDGEGKWITPGLIDLHVHLREPGFEYKEDIRSGCQAAMSGGFTTICCMPNTNPVIDDADTLNYVKEKARQIKGIEVLPIGAITEGQMGERLSEIDEMAALGICAISEDGRTVMNAKLMREAMAKAASLNLPVFSHAEDETLAGTPIGEELIIARDIMLAAETRCRLHICHVSTAGGAEIIRKAKAAGVAVTAETAPHYFTLEASDIKGDGNKKMNPPLRSANDARAIREALRDGTLDAIATDHAPHAKDEKEIDIEKALNGVIGLETSFAVSYTALVRTGILTPLQLIDKMCAAPARILGIDKGDIYAGGPADLAMIDVRLEHEVKKEGFASKSVNSPFIGMHVFGKPELI